MNNEKKPKTTCENKYKKGGEKLEAQEELVAPGDTIRSKIEDKLAEEKLKDRGSAANANAPWAPSGPERIYWAQGPRRLPGKAPRGSGTSVPSMVGTGALHGEGLLILFE